MPAKMMEHSLLAVPAVTNVMRFLPSLNITQADVDEAIQKFLGIFNNINQ